MHILNLVRRSLAALATTLLLLMPSAQAFFDDSELLDPDDAFALTTAVDDGDIVLTWRIADSYYMYREQFELESASADLVFGNLIIPDGTVKEDEFFGRIETYRDAIQIRVPIEHARAGSFEITARSQGCADIGVCYPPHFQTAEIVFDRDISSERSNAREAATGANDPAASSSGNGGLSALASFNQSLGGADDLLAPEDAYRATAEPVSQNAFVVHIDIAEDYYLYRDSLVFRLTSSDGEEAELGTITLPDGIVTDDEFFGESVVYRDQVDIFVPVLRDADSARNWTLALDYQGCADAGICYPPLVQNVDIAFSADLAERAEAPTGDAQPRAPPAADSGRSGSSDLPVSEQDRIAAQLADGRVWLVILVFFGFGLLLTFTPCVFPMIPILSNIIIGQKNLTTGRAFGISLVFVLAMAATYTVAGVFAGLAGANLQAAFQNPWIIGSFVTIFVLLSLSMFGFYELQMPSAIQGKLSQISNHQQGGTWIGAGIMGILSALIVGPCVTAPLIGALLYISQTGDALLGGLALFSLSMGMGAPLLIIGTSAGKLLPKAGPWMDTIKAVFGVGLLAMGIWLLERVIPGEVALLLWGILLIVVAIYMGALQSLVNGASGWRSLWKGLGLVLLVWGVLLMIGAATGSKDPLRPLEGLQSSLAAGGATSGTQQAAPEPAWNAVSDLASLERELKAARDAGTPVLLDFTADWCIDCQRMERNTFRDEQVKSAFTSLHLIKADVTDNNAGHRELLRHYGLFGPPAYVFFDAAGEEQRPMRAIGYIEAKRFLTLLDQGLGVRP